MLIWITTMISQKCIKTVTEGLWISPTGAMHQLFRYKKWGGQTYYVPPNFQVGARAPPRPSCSYAPVNWCSVEWRLTSMQFVSILWLRYMWCFAFLFSVTSTSAIACLEKLVPKWAIMCQLGCWTLLSLLCRLEQFWHRSRLTVCLYNVVVSS